MVRNRVLAAGAALAVAAVLTPAAAEATATERASTNREATAAEIASPLVARGGVVQGDWVRMPNGTEVSLIPMALSDCPNNFVCLFMNGGHGGRMLKWSAPGTRIGHLSDYDFNDEMSSWANKSPYDAKWYVNHSFGGSQKCMQAESSSRSVDPGDSASSLAIFTDTRAC